MTVEFIVLCLFLTLFRFRVSVSVNRARSLPSHRGWVVEAEPLRLEQVCECGVHRAAGGSWLLFHWRR